METGSTTSRVDRESNLASAEPSPSAITRLVSTWTEEAEPKLEALLERTGLA